MKSFAEKIQRSFIAFPFKEFEDHLELSGKGADLIPLVSRLKHEFDFILLLDILAIDNSERSEQNSAFTLVYILHNMELNKRLQVFIEIAHEEEVVSLTGLWKGADWMEREIWDMFGISFHGVAKKRLLNHSEFVGHPLLKNYPLDKRQPCSSQIPPWFKEKAEGDIFSLNPCHPSIQSNIGIHVEIKGEFISQSSVDIGYSHRGFEKLCESLNFNQIIPYTDRLNHQSAAMNNIGWCKAVEDLIGIEIPEKGQALRMVFAELSRIVDHFFVIGATAKDCEIIPDFYFCYELRERVVRLFEKYCGARVTLSLTRVGGLAYDLPMGWMTDCLETLNELKKGVDQLEKKLSRSSVWMERNQADSMNPDDAISWGFTGPSLRACGINYDIRKVRPYYFYDDVDFEVPLGISGTSYDRYLVRIEEIKQSIAIVNQVLENLPSGEVNVDDPSIYLKRGLVDKNDPEAWLNHVHLASNGPIAPSKEIFSSTEAANGELGFYIVGDGTGFPYRVKMRAPSFSLAQSFGQFSKGLQLEDALVSLGSFNIVPGELDR